MALCASTNAKGLNSGCQRRMKPDFESDGV